MEDMERYDKRWLQKLQANKGTVVCWKLHLGFHKDQF